MLFILVCLRRHWCNVFYQLASIITYSFFFFLSYNKLHGGWLASSELVRYLKSVTKYMPKSKKIKGDWTRTENADIYFYVSFERYCKKSTFGDRLDLGQAWGWACVFGDLGIMDLGRACVFIQFCRCFIYS